MANRYYKDPQTPNQALILSPGVFSLSAAAAVIAGTNVGLGWSVAKTGTGLYTVTFQDNFFACLGITTTIETTGTNAIWTRVNSFTLGSSTAGATVVIGTVNGSGAPTDTAAVAKIHFHAFWRNSSVA